VDGASSAAALNYNVVLSSVGASVKAACRAHRRCDTI